MKKGILVFLLGVFATSLLAQNYGSWSETDSLSEKTQNHYGIVLYNQNILITGGITPSNGYGSSKTEIFNISTQKWNTGISMNKGRSEHSLIQLKDSTILAIGGFKEGSCEILNKELTEWTYTDSLLMKRFYGQSTTLLNDGRVLLVGGYSDLPIVNKPEALKECELYSINTNKWTSLLVLNTGRYFHTATLLDNGKVLITGGTSIDNGTIKLNSCELFDPDSNKFSYSSPMHFGRSQHSATKLSNGKVLVVGGHQNICELYDPKLDRWEDVGNVFLSNGDNKSELISNEEFLLIINSIPTSGWELYSLKTFESVYYQEFNRNITNQVVQKICDNRVLLIGGEETILNNDLFLIPTNYCQIFDFALVSVNSGQLSKSLSTDITASCYPNPFNNTANLIFTINNPSKVLIEVYNIIGERIGVIHNGFLNKGDHIFNLDMNTYPSGVYIIKAGDNKNTEFTKIIYQK